MAEILRAVIQGLEATYQNCTVGGMASTFQLLEIAHTHYWVKDSTNRSDLSPKSEQNSPLNATRKSLTSGVPSVSVNLTNLPSTNTQFQRNKNGITSSSANLVTQLGNVETRKRIFHYLPFFFLNNQNIVFSGEYRKKRQAYVQREKCKLFSESFWHESKLSLKRSLASATQTTNAFSPHFDLYSNVKQSLLLHIPFNPILVANPLLSFNDEPMSGQELHSNNVIDKRMGTLLYLLL